MNMFLLRLLLGICIATLSYVLGAKFQEWAWWIGWVGAVTYYTVVALPKGWDRR